MKLDKVDRRRVVSEQLFHLDPQPVIAITGTVEKCGPAVERELARVVKELHDALMTLRRTHAAAPSLS